MDGHSFVTKLKSLKIEGVDSLRDDDFDWVFLNKKNRPLVLFWKWFFANVCSEDVLSDEELNEYEELLSTGSILSSNHLMQIESHLGPILPDEDSQFNLKMDEHSEDDVDRMNKELKKLKMRKNQLSLERLEVEDKLRKRREGVQHLRKSLEPKRRDSQLVCNYHTKALEEVSSSIQEAVQNFKPFQREPEEAKFISQIQSAKWLQEEASYQASLSKYIYKQFQEGVDAIAGQTDSSTSSSSTSSFLLLDSGQLDLQFVRGPRQAQYLLHTKELRRINAMLEENEVRSVEVALLKADGDARISEVTKVIKMVKRRPPMTDHVLRQEVASVQEARVLAEQDLRFQRKFLEEEAMQVAQIERLKVVSGDYEVKLKRQEYVLDKHAFVKERLLRQLSRFDLMKVVLDIEAQKVHAILELLSKLHLALATEFSQTEHRLSNLKDLKQHCLKDGPVLKEKNLLEALLKPNQENQPPKSDKDLVRLGTNILKSLKSCEREIESITDAKLKHVSKLYKSCSDLEEVLFGTKTAIGTVAASWLDSGILDREAKMEQRSWQTQHAMLDALRDYHKKKKVLEDNASLQDMMRWTKKLNL